MSEGLVWRHSVGVCLLRPHASKPEKPHSALVWGPSGDCEPYRDLLLSKIFAVHRWPVIKSYRAPLKSPTSLGQERVQDSQQEERRMRHR